MSDRRPYHPPRISHYDPPGNFNPDYIKGQTGWQGFGCQDFFVALVPVGLAREIIIREHYSHRIVNNSYLHLGVYLRGKLEGVLQFGYALNPRRAGKIVANTEVGEYLELNRMWLSENAPRNSESRAISYAVKYIKRAMPMVAWIQSFADERCGRWGVVYQAANFLYCGFHKTRFFFLGGDYYHDMLLTCHRKGGVRGRFLRENIDRAEARVFRQFRYIYFIKRAWIKRLNLQIMPYPKPEVDS